MTPQALRNAQSNVQFLAENNGTLRATGPIVLPGPPASGLQAATKAYVDDAQLGGGDVQAQLDGKAALVHVHTIANVTSLQAALDAKAASSHAHAIADSTGLQTALDGKAASAHSHAIGDSTGLQTALDAKAALSHSHAIADSTGLQTALDAKVTGTPLIFVPRLPTEFYSDRYGILPNAECTAAVQAVIDEMNAGRGGDLIFMEPEPYLFAGALQDGARRNAQLLLPSIAITAVQKTFSFRGCIVPAFSPSGGTNTPLPQATTLKSTLSAGSGTLPAFIGGRGPVGGPNAECTYIHLEMSNLVVQLPSNPSFSGLNLNSIGNLHLNNLIVVAGTAMSTPQITQATTLTSYGVRLPRFSSGVLQEIGHVNILGFYTGMLGGELMNAQNIGAWNCNVGVEFPFAYDDCLIQRLLIFLCPVGVRFTAVCPVRVLSYVNEFEAVGQWYSRVYDIDDVGNLGSANIEWQNTQINVGRVSSFVKNGATGVIAVERGT